MKKKIAYVTGSRADYGIVRKYLKYLQDDDNMDLEVVVTGALLDEKYGRQVRLIEDDGFIINHKVEIPIDATSNESIIHTMAVALDKFGTVFANNKFDLVIILGDRYEIFSVAIAAAIHNLPILHLHGGEATFANYDEFIRHAITKMSLYHFTATEEYRKRVIQLGEDPLRVSYLGALGAENCLDINEKNVPTSVKKLEEKKYFVVLFHPETISNANVEVQMQELLTALSNLEDYKIVFLGTNADTNADVIRNMVKNFVDNHDYALYYENLHTDAYHYLVKHSMCLIGNSSSGIIEAPSLEVYTINIGDRQDGRARGDSVIDVPCDKEKISEAIDYVIKTPFDSNYKNPYYKENSAYEYYLKTKEILENINVNNKPKRFYDLNIEGD